MQCDFVGQAYKGRSIAIDGQELVNYFVEKNQENSKARYSLIPTPGLEFVTSVPGIGGCRGLFTTARERLFMVMGNQLVELVLSEDGLTKTLVTLGQLKTVAGRVNFAEVITSTGSIVALVDGAYGYYVQTVGSVSTFGQFAGDYQPGSSIVSLNGYFLQNTSETWYGGTRFIRSGQYDDATNWGADIGDGTSLDTYFTAEVSPDPIRSLQVASGELWIFGSKTTEVWYFTGDTDLRFARTNVGHINIGTAGRDCCTTINNQICWLGSGPNGNGSIWLTSGYIPQQISTGAIEYIIGQMDVISDCIAFSYMQEGNTFVIFNFISGNRTLVYDLSTGFWHERASYTKKTGQNNRHRVVNCTLWRERIYVGDYSSNILYEWSLDRYDDAGETIRRVRTAAHIHNDRKRVRFNAFEIDFERGVSDIPTNPEQSAADAKIMLQWSDDGGFTWSNEHWATVGRRGNRFARARWTKLGQSRDRVFRTTFSDPVKYILIDARMDVEVGLH